MWTVSKIFVCAINFSPRKVRGFYPAESGSRVSFYPLDYDFQGRLMIILMSQLTNTTDIQLF